MAAPAGAASTPNPVALSAAVVTATASLVRRDVISCSLRLATGSGGGLSSRDGLCAGNSDDVRVGSDGFEGRCGGAGRVTTIASPGGPRRRGSTTAITPARRTRLPAASRSSTARCSPGWYRSSWTHGLRSPVHLDHRVGAKARAGYRSGGRAGRRPRRGDVLAERSRGDVEAGGGQLVEQLAGDQVHLAQVRRRRVAPHPRPVLDRHAGSARRPPPRARPAT